MVRDRPRHPRLSPLGVMLNALIVALLVGIGAPNVRAQFVEGDLVLQDDGSLYVFEGGQLHAVLPVPATSDAVQAAPMGDPVTNGVMMIPPPAPAAAGPAPGLRMTVLSVERPSGRSPDPGREWAQIRLRIENGTSSTFNAGAFLAPPVKVNVWDARGATSVARGAETDSLRSSFTIPPGGAAEGNLRFDVAANVPLVRVTWNDRDVVLMEAPVP